MLVPASLSRGDLQAKQFLFLKQLLDISCLRYLFYSVSKTRVDGNGNRILTAVSEMIAILLSVTHEVCLMTARNLSAYALVLAAVPLNVLQ